MSNFKSVNAIDLVADKAFMNELKAQQYKGLPRCSENEAGVVKVDGITIIVNSKGQLTTKTENYGKLLNHIKNNQIHLNPDDTDNLNALRRHLKDSSTHFINGEKSLWLDILDKSELHYKQNHLTKEEVEDTSKHIKNNDKHFDNKEQKKEVLGLLEEALRVSQGIPDRILVTDSKGNVSVSTISSHILGCISDINSGTFSYFDDRYASLSHTHPEISNFGSHIMDNNVHFKKDEKEKFLRDLADINEHLEKEKETYVTFDDIKEKANAEHNQDAATIFFENKQLDEVLRQVLKDIEALKTT